MNKHGDWIWYELMTTDADAATRFYGAVVGWSVARPTADGLDYREITAPSGEMVGGMLTLTPEMTTEGARPAWVGYLAVDDVDRAVASITKSGGQVLMPAHDLPGVGRFAMVADPAGAPFYVMRGTVERTSHAFAGSDGPRAGHCAWNELQTADPAAALSFYTAQFGWARDGELDMGHGGKYHLLRHGPQIGGVMAQAPGVPRAGWSFYFRVADIDAAVAAIAAGGGRMMVGPIPVPGGDFAVHGLDPQGAAFAVVGQRR
jgi:predicted enzyme related to lactoylglutathione lyase